MTQRPADAIAGQAVTMDIDDFARWAGRIGWFGGHDAALFLKFLARRLVGPYLRRGRWGVNSAKSV